MLLQSTIAFGCPHLMPSTDVMCLFAGGHLAVATMLDKQEFLSREQSTERLRPAFCAIRLSDDLLDRDQ